MKNSSFTSLVRVHSTMELIKEFRRLSNLDDKEFQKEANTVVWVGNEFDTGWKKERENTPGVIVAKSEYGDFPIIVLRMDGATKIGLNSRFHRGKEKWYCTSVKKKIDASCNVG